MQEWKGKRTRTTREVIEERWQGSDVGEYSIARMTYIEIGLSCDLG